MRRGESRQVGAGRVAALLGIVILALVMVGCGREVGSAPADIEGRQIRAVATTGMVGDVARNVGDERVAVTTLMGPGIDPHLYKASARDVEALDEADILFYNGLHLEGRMTSIFERLSVTRPTVAVAEGIPAERLLRPPEFEGAWDPHVWFDVELWSYTIDAVRDALVALDPAHAATYHANADAYRADLAALDAWVADRVATISANSRLLITAHDAFGYMGAAYGLEVRGLQGASTATEAGAADVRGLADLIVERRIKAIFVESSVPKATIEAVQAAVRARGHEVTVGGQLFSDAMGGEGTPEGTYVGMVRHNVETIVSALR
ncbi:MAG TPA: zinc ABC transporter substrate-binding protein [Thermomicrobiales bacterium]|nr:zinc ABC transporter substrate-binding protein [Thermomicrobiales bacterium]